MSRKVTGILLKSEVKHLIAKRKVQMGHSEEIGCMVQPVNRERDPSICSSQGWQCCMASMSRNSKRLTPEDKNTQKVVMIHFLLLCVNAMVYCLMLSCCPKQSISVAPSGPSTSRHHPVQPRPLPPVSLLSCLLPLACLCLHQPRLQHMFEMLTHVHICLSKP